MEIYIINPNTTKRRKFKCHACGISYSKSEYKLLFNSKKLVYFKIAGIPYKRKEMMICHDCFYKHVNRLFDMKEFKNEEYIRVAMIDGDKKYDCKFYSDQDISFLGEI